MSFLHPCGICENTGNNVAWTAREMMFGTKAEFTYFECAACGCLQLRDIPADLSSYYGGGYYSHDRPSFAERLARRLRENYVRRRRGLLGRFIHGRFPDHGLVAIRDLGLGRDARILDVGTGTGSFLFSLRRFGFRHLVGADPFLDHETDARGVKLLRRTILEIDGGWDLITFNHSFEHIVEQHETMGRIAELLSADGVCMIRVPVLGWAWTHYQTNWVQLDAPRHIYLHTAGSLARLAAEHGLGITHTAYDSTDFQIWGSELYVRDIALRRGGKQPWQVAREVFSGRDLKEFRERAARLNAEGRGDQAMFLLERA